MRAAAPETCPLVPPLEFLGDSCLAESPARRIVLQRGSAHYAAVGGHQSLVAQGSTLLIVGSIQGCTTQLPLARWQVAFGHHHIAPRWEISSGQQKFRVVSGQLSATGWAPGPAMARWLRRTEGPQKGDVWAAAAG